MDGGILHAALVFNQIRHPPGGPEAGAISQGFRPPLQTLLDALAIGGR